MNTGRDLTQWDAETRLRDLQCEIETLDLILNGLVDDPGLTLALMGMVNRLNVIHDVLHKHFE